jgi:hypothetical protein
VVVVVGDAMAFASLLAQSFDNLALTKTTRFLYKNYDWMMTMTSQRWQASRLA